MKLPIALTIAGSDSGGGAGIQADLKTFAVLGVHGTSAITAVTAQNTVGVTDILELPASLIRAQVDQIVHDLWPGATKTGMLSSAEIIEAVAAAIAEHQLPNLVVDPVMVAKGGARLLREDAVGALRERLLPLATILTPNLPEAEVLLERELATEAAREKAVRELRELGATAVVLKGGHLEGPAVDLFYDGSDLVPLSAERVETTTTHGSGCAFSAAIAAGLARGLTPLEAALEAKDFITGAIQGGLELGAGHGPVNPAWRNGPE